MGQLGKLLRCFRSDDTGAVTIDWVALTSALLLLGIMIVYSIFDGGVNSLVSSVNSTLSAAVVTGGADPDPDGDDGDGERTGNAADRACFRTANYIVCMGPK